MLVLCCACTVLCCIVLCCVVLCCIVLYCDVLCCVVLYYVALCCAWLCFVFIVSCCDQRKISSFLWSRKCRNEGNFLHRESTQIYQMFPLSLKNQNTSRGNTVRLTGLQKRRFPPQRIHADLCKVFSFISSRGDTVLLTGLHK